MECRAIDMHAGATLDTTAKLHCRVSSGEFADLVWEWGRVEFAVTVERDVLRELVRQGAEALLTLDDFTEREADGEEVGEVRIYQDAPTEQAPPGVSWRNRKALS